MDNVINFRAEKDRRAAKDYVFGDAPPEDVAGYQWSTMSTERLPPEIVANLGGIPRPPE